MPLSRIYFLLFAFCNQTVAKIVTHTHCTQGGSDFDLTAQTKHAHTHSRPTQTQRQAFTHVEDIRALMHTLIDHQHFYTHGFCTLHISVFISRASNICKL